MRFSQLKVNDYFIPVDALPSLCRKVSEEQGFCYAYADLLDFEGDENVQQIHIDDSFEIVEV